MSHTTTSTSSYTLLKYSRSYPSASGMSQAAPKDMEWQHFANPVIQLVLDVTKNTDTTLASVRLRIIWNMELAQDPADASQRDVIFEDLDLLAFSECVNDPRHQVVNMQGSPLKAVYRDSIVGIRYLHPRHSTTPVNHLSYRRFQINFASSADAEQFIDIIRPVCPCKLNGPPPPALARNATMNPGAISTRPPLSISSSFLASSIQTPSAPVRRTTAHPSTLTTPQTQMPAYIKPADKTTPSSSSGLSICTSGSSARLSSVLPDSSSRPSSAVDDSVRDSGLPTPVSATTGTGAYTQQHTPDTGSGSSFAQDRPPAAVRRNSARDISSLMHGTGEGSSYLPSSSPPSSAAAQQGTMLPPPVPTPRKRLEEPRPPLAGSRPAESAETTRSAFVASLRESTDLCDLSRSELEGLVNHVIREPGFGKLLETLDSLWVVKGFLSR
ncbi:hypothetical protein EVG20_g9892 [Dentipellis fragilis]|uniref:Uncharacterized protein n=1 Tax=Dentipellis fragilis TaxID=205917 RepID=A0A4Y9XW36_9AGAM|nr:hypothetical protein EVG20_g9892 [Dentipellis fragilis]